MEILHIRPAFARSVQVLLDSGEVLYKDISPFLEMELTDEEFESMIFDGDEVQFSSGQRIEKSRIESLIAPAPLQSLKQIANKAQLNEFESELAARNLAYFLPYFTYPLSRFELTKGQKRELADHIVMVRDKAIILQLKDKSVTGQGTLQSWFNNKVLKVAKKQIANSQEMLRELESIPLVSATGRTVKLSPKSLQRIHNVICYRNLQEHAVETSVLPKFLDSRSAGFIHLFEYEYYALILDTLVTFAEVFEYLGFREELIQNWKQENNLPTEAAMLGQFICGDDNARPAEHYKNVLAALSNNTGEFDLSYFLGQFDRDVEQAVASDEHMEILEEFAILNRSELKHARDRLVKCIAFCRSGSWDDFDAWRFLVSPTGPSFLFVGINAEADNAEKLFMDLVYASKHDTKVYRQISVGVWRRGEAVNFRWGLCEGDPIEWPEMDAKLTASNPFREMTVRVTPRYKIN
jgi:hypothetical protein